MNWLDILRIVGAFVLGALAVWVGIIRIPWTPRNDEDQN